MSFARIAKNPKALTLLFIVLYTLLMFRVVWPADVVIQSGDYNYGLMAFYKSEMPESFTQGFWRSFPLLGRVGYPSPTWTHLVLGALPVDTYMDWIYGINLALSSVFLIAFLRLKGISLISSLVGALTAYWLGSNLTLILPGHLEKYAVVLFATVSLYCLEQTLRTRSVRWSILSGGALGMMFMHQPDLALFFGLLLGCWFLFEGITRIGKHPRALAACALPLFIPALMFVYESYRFSMETHVRNVTVLEEGTPDQKWDFITQWSWPPAESIDLIAPGFMGWYSGHPQAPYHGVMGQSPNYSPTQGGMVNLKSESQYLGILPIGLALMAFGFAIFKGTSREHRSRILFWTGAAFVTYLLACGKFTPFYRLFMQLPLVGSIRNPNKFLQVYQVCIGILCAYGLETVIQTDWTPRVRRLTAGFFLCVALGAGLGALITNPADPVQLTSFTGSPWESSAPGILQNRQSAWIHLAGFAIVGCGLMAATALKSLKSYIPFVILLCVAADGLMLGKHYLKPFDTGFIKQNRVADFLNDHLGNERVALLETGGIYNAYLTHVFPARGIPFANIAVAPRLQQDYQNYFNALVPDRNGAIRQAGFSPLSIMQGLWLPLTQYDPYRQQLDFANIARNQVRYWQEFGVKYILARRNTWEYLRRFPGFDQALSEVFRYEITVDSGEHVVLMLNDPAPRFALMPSWEKGTTEEALEAILNNELPLSVSRVQGEIESGSASPDPGDIDYVKATGNGFQLKVLVRDEQAFLRIADTHSPFLFAEFKDGSRTPLLQTDGLFSGLLLERGIHEITLGFEAPSTGRILQWLALTGCLLIWITPVGIRLYRYVFTDR